MRALCWHGKDDVRVQDVPEPELINDRDAIVDPSFVVTHRVPLRDAPAMYRTFRDKEDDCVKVVPTP
jgi:threonine dehydrogenase-like Zn-dependent dehydrogenase